MWGFDDGESDDKPFSWLSKQVFFFFLTSKFLFLNLG
jgi:hypothetical protein